MRKTYIVILLICVVLLFGLVSVVIYNYQHYKKDEVKEQTLIPPNTNKTATNLEPIKLFLDITDKKGNKLIDVNYALFLGIQPIHSSITKGEGFELYENSIFGQVYTLKATSSDYYLDETTCAVMNREQNICKLELMKKGKITMNYTTTPESVSLIITVKDGGINKPKLCMNYPAHIFIYPTSNAAVELVPTTVLERLQFDYDKCYDIPNIEDDYRVYQFNIEKELPDTGKINFIIIDYDSELFSKSYNVDTVPDTLLTTVV